ncbi:MAG: pseudouridine synthase [Cytophagales bacterium]|nr:pseudouridine synthase [Cytophagales bacterium]
MLEIIYEDEELVAINKPAGLLVHRTALDRREKEFAMLMLRDQIGQHVFPVHRIDRPTSGVLLFTKSAALCQQVQTQFQENKVHKSYWLIARGFVPEQGEIDLPITDPYSGKMQEALTRFHRLATAEINIPSGKFSTSRYSLVEASPVTGRTHQIRKHFAKLRHYLIGDRVHGDNKQNKLFDQHVGKGMLLHARSLRMVHPISKKNLVLEAPLHEHFEKTLRFLSLNPENAPTTNNKPVYPSFRSKCQNIYS